MITGTLQTYAPTLINQEALELLITHIQKHRFIVRDWGCTLEHLHGYMDIGVEMTAGDFKLKEQLGVGDDHISYMLPIFNWGISAPTKTWAGLDRNDPYIDLPRFPKSHLLRDQLHTWESYSNLVYAKANGIGLRQMVLTLQRMPTNELGF